MAISVSLDPSMDRWLMLADPMMMYCMPQGCGELLITHACAADHYAVIK